MRNNNVELLTAWLLIIIIIFAYFSWYNVDFKRTMLQMNVQNWTCYLSPEAQQVILDTGNGMYYNIELHGVTILRWLDWEEGMQYDLCE